MNHMITNTTGTEDLDDVADAIELLGCVAHKDDLDACVFTRFGVDGQATFRVAGDLWCSDAVDSFGHDFPEEIAHLDRPGPFGTVAGSPEALWIEQNVGLN